MTLGALLLRQWRRRNGLSQAALAERLEAHPRRIGHYETTGHVPTLPYAFAIERATECCVPAWSWLRAAAEERAA
jgi:transcriptional regulator with XRE-family HTH domain